jgi:hypothetical protein
MAQSPGDRAAPPLSGFGSSRWEQCHRRSTALGRPVLEGLWWGADQHSRCFFGENYRDPHERVRAIEARMVAALTQQEQRELVRLLDACATALTPTGSAAHARHQATQIPAGGPGTRQQRGSPS